MTKRLMIAKDVAFNTGVTGWSDISSLADGVLAFLADNGALVDQTSTMATDLASSNNLHVILGSGTAPVAMQVTIPKNHVRSFGKKAYNAGTKQIAHVGYNGSSGAMNLPGTLVAGDIAVIRVVDKSRGTMPPKYKKSYEYVVRTGDTAALTVDGIVAAINADVNRQVNALAISSSTGISLTAINFDSTFEVVADEIAAAATITYSTPVVFRTGGTVHMTALELAHSVAEGNTNQIYQSNRWYSRATRVVSDGTTAGRYDLWTIEWVSPHYTPTAKENASINYLTIAVPVSGTSLTTANFLAMLKAAFPEANYVV